MGAETSLRIALVGARGMLAQAVARQIPAEAVVVKLDLPEFDLTDQKSARETLSAFAPTLIINCAAFTNVDGCEEQETLATAINGAAVGTLAAAAKSLGATLVHISTDYVFDGEKREPYLETDIPNPRSAYGRSKLAGEQAVIKSGLSSYFIIRTSWLYGPGGNNFVETILRLAKEREQLRIVADQQGTPTYTADLAAALFSLLETQAFGVYHFSNLGQCSWYEFAQEIIRLAKGQGRPLKVQEVLPITTSEYPLPAARPAYSVFSKEKYLQATGAVIPDWRESLASYFHVRK